MRAIKCHHDNEDEDGDGERDCEEVICDAARLYANDAVSVTRKDARAEGHHPGAFPTLEPKLDDVAIDGCECQELLGLLFCEFKKAFAARSLASFLFLRSFR